MSIKRKFKKDYLKISRDLNKAVFNPFNLRINAFTQTKANPGELVHIGEQKIQKTAIQLFEYNEAGFEEYSVEDLSSLPPFEDDKIYWLNFHGIHDIELMKKLGSRFGIEKLIMDDLLDTTQRPKAEFFDDYIFFTLKSIYEVDEYGMINVEQISFILGDNYIISLQEKEQDIFEYIRDRIRTKRGNARFRGSEYLQYLLLEAVIDNYFVVLDKIGVEVITLQELMLKKTEKENYFRIDKVKKNLYHLKKSIQPVKEAVLLLERIQHPYLKDDVKKYFSELKDDVLNILDSIDLNLQYSDSLENYHFSSLSQKTNDIMQVLTIVSSIFIPLTFIAGIYGMNFEHMPELQTKNGYFTTLGAMGLIAISLIVYFWRKGWLGRK